jgi:hypothetical protein
LDDEDDEELDSEAEEMPNWYGEFISFSLFSATK